LRPGDQRRPLGRHHACRFRQLERVRHRLAVGPGLDAFGSGTPGVPAGQFRSVPAVPRRCRAAAGGDRVPRAGSCAAACPPARLGWRAGARRAPGAARGQRARLRPDRTETPVITLTALPEKYDVPVPRYTSYPTVPQWHDTPSTDEWIASVGRAAGRTDAGLAVYVHLP